MATVVGIVTGTAAVATTVRVGTPEKVSGNVASVNGSSAPGSCGTAGSAGDFTVSSDGATATVDVGGSTTSYKERGVRSPSFADVCVGDKGTARGVVSAPNVLAATSVTVVPPRPVRESGTVASVNGSSSDGSCGTSGSAGAFTLSSNGATKAVDVDPSSTVFRDRGASAPSFADVCVGDKVKAVGALASGVLDATRVTVVPPHPVRESGTVTSVNGTGTPGACGVSGAAGAFTMSSHKAVDAVDVDGSSTAFKERNVGAPTFADVCVGDKVRATGTLVSGVLQATRVTVVPPPPTRVAGTVVSVDGTSTPGACGTAGADGTFTVSAHQGAAVVDVAASSTTFSERNVSAPSFADVCVGTKVTARGTKASSGALDATSVTVAPPRPKKVSGTVLSVNGASTSQTCGSAGTSGTFTVSYHNTSYTVDVAPTSTIFKEQGVSAPSFSLVCTGGTVRARGMLYPGNVVSASVVTIVPSR
ncbi:MAG TPA: hypothetical protein VLZ77_08315 [Acidimicrobiales bacterium]|nr:hypothetical protein [Acidimicrobiales bacterium]